MDFSNAETHFVTARHQQGPRVLVICEHCWKGHFDDTVKVEGRKGDEEQQASSNLKKNPSQVRFVFILAFPLPTFSLTQ